LIPFKSYLVVPHNILKQHNSRPFLCKNLRGNLSICSFDIISINSALRYQAKRATSKGTAVVRKIGSAVVLAGTALFFGTRPQSNKLLLFDCDRVAVFFWSGFLKLLMKDKTHIFIYVTSCISVGEPLKPHRRDDDHIAAIITFD